MNSTPLSKARSLGSSALRWWNDEGGVSSIEYGLVAALVVLVCIGAFSAFGDALTAVYKKWSDAVLAALS